MTSFVVRLVSLWVLPGWAVVLLAFASTGFTVLAMAVVLVVSAINSPASADLYYQCDSAVGPDPANTVTVAVPAPARDRPRASGSSSGTSTSAAPTTNPYAELTIASDDTNASAWQRACVSAMKSAPYQLEPLLTGNDGVAAECARELALGGLSASSVVGGAGSDGSTGPIDSAAMTRSLIYQASAAALTGRCERSVGLASAPSAPVAPLAGGGSAQSTGAAAEACGRPITGTVVTLPNALAEQGVCGQRVDLSAVSAGDLIFWDYRDSAPTHVGVATGGTQLVTIDPISGRFVQQSMPTANDVRAKRVLGGGV